MRRELGVQADNSAVLDPIPTVGMTAADVDELAISTRELMLKEMIALTEKVRRQSVAASPQKTTDEVVKASGRRVPA